MMGAAMLEPTEQRILGVLLEKELSVPDSYPMTENALLAGCNQKNNRDPIMELEAFQVAGALTSLRLKEWVVKIEGGRADHYRHRVEERLDVRGAAKAVLAELLVRGPQAPGALKPRVARLGFAGSPEEIEAVLQQLAQRPAGALVEQLSLQPRERDRRWAHLLGPRAGAAPAADPELPRLRPVAAAAPGGDLHERVARIETELSTLRDEVAALRALIESGGSSSD